MFLFTTPSSGSTAAQPARPSAASAATRSSGTETGAAPILDAIREGAARSGTSFDYLLTTAKKESALDPTAKAPTSSASGLFQFIEQTWLGLVKSDGAKAGLGDYAAAVTARGDGTLTVADPDTKQAILKLREDPELASAFAGTLARKNRAVLASETGRDPSAGDLYVAHVLGARGASELINTMSTAPARVAAADFPEAAAANRGLFYDRSGRARSAADVYAALTASYSGQTTAMNGEAKDVATPLVPMQSGPPLQGLFQTGSRSGPVSDAVARIWRTNNTVKTAAAAASFFPRETTTAEPSTVVGAAGDAASRDPTARASSELESIAASVASPSASSRFAPPGLPPLPPVRPRFSSDPTGRDFAGPRVLASSSQQGPALSALKASSLKDPGP